MKIISGGQTGADRGGLEAGLALGVTIGGYVPKYWRAEDGHVPFHYPMQAHESSGYPGRTEANVVFSDATIIFHVGRLERGSKLTRDLCRQHGRLHLVVPLDDGEGGAIVAVRDFIQDDVGIAIWAPDFTLNIAGNRESVCPGIQESVKAILVEALKAYVLL